MDFLTSEQIEMFETQKRRTYPKKKEKRQSLELTRTVISLDLQGYISKTAVNISEEMNYAKAILRKPNVQSVWIRPDHPVNPREFFNIETGEVRQFRF